MPINSHVGAMKRVVRLLLCFVVFMAIAAGVFSLLFWLVGEKYFQEGTLLRNAFKMVPWVMLFGAWQYTADKPVATEEEAEARAELKAKEDKRNSYSPEDY